MITKESLIAQPLRDAIFNAKAGDVAGPIESKSGYHILKIESRLPSVLIPLEQVVKDVEPIVLQEKIGDKFDQQIEIYKKAAKIEKFVKD
jgi:parvulin-like peptidyl-prolyl isomerase